MKKLKHLTLLTVFTILTVSCSSDDDNSGFNNDKSITVGESAYEMKSALVEHAPNSVFLSLTNKAGSELEAGLNGTTLNDLDFFSVTITSAFLTETTYDLSDMAYLNFSTEGDLIGAELENETTQFYLGDGTSDLRIVDGSITITSYTEDFISLNFNFTRNDDTEITGTYEGNFMFISNGLE
ncbi:hypothetical protein [Winogradskyella sp. SM1960]|uniref:hypothetical protein n=1 Tax=Winogradskyella sp. SM1960 TaxID=2865955 RepID=UPI001CD541BD|nr:hypothetical protein [Winogradskyella sp. SM1960]